MTLTGTDVEKQSANYVQAESTDRSVGVPELDRNRQSYRECCKLPRSDIDEDTLTPIVSKQEGWDHQ